MTVDLEVGLGLQDLFQSRKLRSGERLQTHKHKLLNGSVFLVFAQEKRKERASSQRVCTAITNSHHR